MIVSPNSTIHMYHSGMLPDLMRREIFIDDILALVAVSDGLKIRDIQCIFKLDLNATRKILNFLAKFDFVELEDEFVKLSRISKPFFDEILVK